MTNLKVTITEVPDPLLPDNVIAVIDGTPIVAAGKNKQEVWKELMISLAITIAHNSDLDYKELTYELKDSPYQGSAGVGTLSREPVPGIQLNCISREARELLDRIMEAWEPHCQGMKEGNGDYEPGFYGFAYWLVRWSGLVQSAASPAGDGWTPLTSGNPLPDYDEPMLWITESGNQFVQALGKDESIQCFRDATKATHYRPLPSPPNKSV